MAKFTSTVPLNIRWLGNDINGAAGATHRIPDALYDEFNAAYSGVIPGLTWVTQDEASAVAGFDPATKYDKTGGTISGDVQANGRFGIVDSPSNRIPVNLASDITAGAAGSAGSSNVIGIEMSPRIVGDFSTVTGVDQGFVWGVNDFTVIGQSGSTVPQKVNDGTALLAEMAVIGSAVTATSLRALHADISYYGASAGGAVTTMESLRVTPPRRKEGATGGSITNAYGLFIEAPTATYASSGNFALYTEGGPSRFTGRLDVDTAVTGHNGSVELFADFTRTAGASIKLERNSAGGHAIVYASNTAGYLGVSDGTNIKHKLMRNGIVTTGDTAFPAGPSVNDLFYRTDYDGWYYYDGTRWLSEQLHSQYLGPAGSNLTFPISVAGFPLIGVLPYNTVGTRQDVYVVGWRVISMVATSNNASNFWTVTLERHPSVTSVASFTTASDTADVQTIKGGAIGALLGTSDTRLALNCTKTGTPGSLSAPTFLEYRLVGV